MAAVGAAALLPSHPSHASDDSFPTDAMAMLNRFHPPRPDWYAELYATAMNTSMKSYEAEIEGYKSELFANLRGQAKQILEIGIGTGPNLKYYASEGGTSVYGVDPNRKMEKYAQAAAEAAGLPPANFKFLHAVSESLPLRDASVDAVIGTLVLCSVADVNLALQEIRRVLKPGGLYLFVEHVAATDGTVLRFVQQLLDPLQQTLADGCHLTRKTGKDITEAGFSNVSESLPLRDASVDAVIGTLVLCSVADVNLTLQEVRKVLKPGGIYLFVEHVAAAVLRFVQGLLDPLQQMLADGCHLTRKTGKNITEEGFSNVIVIKLYYQLPR
ncbi:hypothetical protein K7X08_003387 [Anisodus acutangulus]|uniref:Methyltransferase type 11 domain-containing protein n=1 Tax=Anisodus acutangulus TaxID=402998 RepID=A0A9Q1MJ54_9SOLA|nr:hypothetical protein K7X08_003387 [Anisodus acutangulus]